MSIMTFIPCPATGATFIGREGLVRSLRARIAKGESLAVIGGPKLGKTSLVRTALNELSDRTVIEIDLGTDSSPEFEMVPESIVVLDNLDAIADSAIESLLARVSAAGASSTVVTGGRRLRMCQRRGAYPLPMPLKFNWTPHLLHVCRRDRCATSGHPQPVEGWLSKPK